MAPQAGWRVLPLDSDLLPQLLVKAELSGPDGYGIKVTDLCNIWGEAAPRAQVVRKAADAGCSIDPSEDDDQYKILLAKLDSALNCEPGTSLVLKTQPHHDTNLQLSVTATLPKPLPDLCWSFDLQPLPALAIASELVTPLLHQSQSLQTQTQQLIQELREKDRAISKIVDRLEQSGNDLTTVFPGVSNVTTKKRNGSQRDQLARHVRGLGDFDELLWRSQNSATAGSHGPWESSEMNDVLRSLPSADDFKIDPNWRQRLSDVHELKSPRSARPEPSQASEYDNTVDDAYVAMAQDDGFQRQHTPPPTAAVTSEIAQRSTNLAENSSFTKSTDQQMNGDSTTEDEDDLDAPPVRKDGGASGDVMQMQTLRHTEPQPTRKLGALGGRRPSPRTSRNSSPVLDKAPPQGGRASPTPQATLASPAKPATTRSKLGAFGGQKKAPAPVPEKRALSSSKAVDSLPAAEPSKLGTFGGQKRERDVPVRAIDYSAATQTRITTPRRVSPSTKTPEPAIEMTEEERANVKRDQLRKEMEEKARAPVKKKRKF